MKPILCLDFDGVLHSYTSGWQGAAVIPDPPVPGAIEFLAEASKHFKIAIYSSRSHQEGGVQAMMAWLLFHASEISPIPPWLFEIDFLAHKPAAFLSIDDRAITFTGKFPTVEEMLAFKPWYKR